MNATTKTAKLDEARLARETRYKAEPTIELVADELDKAGVQYSLDHGIRRIGEDGFNLQASIDLDDADGITKAVAFITIHAEGQPIVFTRLECPKMTGLFTTNLYDSKQRLAGRAARAYDVVGDKFVTRVDFLFKPS